MRPAKIIVLGLMAVVGGLQAEPSVTIQSKNCQAGVSVNEWAQYTLSTSGMVTVKNGANVRFSAGNSITL